MNQKKKVMDQITVYIHSVWKQKPLVESINMWEMVLIVLVRNTHAPFVTNRQQHFRPTGFGKILGNKGGLLISMKIYNTLYCFINVHLVHGQNSDQKRNEMMSDILKHTKTAREEMDPDIMADCCILLGDLNYRLNTTFNILVNDIQNISNYLKDDQLLYAQTNYQNYLGYYEGPLNFMPTYKWKCNEEEFINKKDQAPSFTDRILIKDNVNLNVNFETYQGLRNVKGSDHRPVYASIQIDKNTMNFPNDFKTIGRIQFEQINIVNLDLSLLEKHSGGRILFPSYLQFSFYSDFVNTQPSSWEMTINEFVEFQHTIQWSQNQIPVLYSPYNNLEQLKNNKIVILLWLTNQYASQVVIGQIILPMNELVNDELKDINKRMFIENGVLGCVHLKVRWEVVNNTIN